MTTRDLSPAEERALQRAGIRAQLRETRQQRDQAELTSDYWRAQARICEGLAQLAELDEAEAAEREAK